jgi:S-adenosylmethionine:tRNA ribosyltransferase-isomerase
MHPKNLSISDFTYGLPADRIARFPLEKRDNSKLIVFENGEITQSLYRNLDSFLPENSLLVFNNTKVVEARLLFKKQTGAVIEIFCLEPGEDCLDVTTAMLQKGKVRWKCLIGGASKWKHGMILKKVVNSNEEEVVLEAAIVDQLADCFIIELTWQPSGLSFAEVLHLAGFIPLPPYLHRDVEENDKTRYQTIYAKHDGSVAAPTAGLHFTESIFKKLSAKNIRLEFVTLHVGAGTFKPVKSERLNEHEMHAEFIEVSVEAINNLINYAGKTIVAVGTTSLRTIESLYWMGVKLKAQPNATIDEISVKQWDPYEIKQETISAEEALLSLLRWMEKNLITRLITKTQIIIAPGYSLKIAKGIITNFHQPQSTLLLLIAAIIGNDWKNVYDYALKNDFRFLSYGDGCLLWETDKNST